MFFFNRKEVYCGYSIKDFGEVREKLACNKIKYDYRVVNNNNSSHNRTHSLIGTMGENMNFQNLYYVYVRRQDYEVAKGVLGK